MVGNLYLACNFIVLHLFVNDELPYFVSSKPPILIPPEGALPNHVVWVVLLDDLYENHLFLMGASRENPL